MFGSQPFSTYPLGSAESADESAVFGSGWGTFGGSCFGELPIASESQTGVSEPEFTSWGIFGGSCFGSLPISCESQLLTFPPVVVPPTIPSTGGFSAENLRPRRGYAPYRRLDKFEETRKLLEVRQDDDEFLEIIRVIALCL